MSAHYDATIPTEYLSRFQTHDEKRRTDEKQYNLQRQHKANPCLIADIHKGECWQNMTGRYNQQRKITV